MIDASRKEGTVPTDSTASAERHLGRRLIQNTAALVVGRNLNALGRLVTAGMVVRSLGTSVFGEYALIIVWMTIAEWILDFGTTEVFVREANQAPERRAYLVRVFLALKVIQAPAAILVMMLGLIAMQYARGIVLAGMTASLSLFFLAGVTLYGATFKARLTMEREVAAEFVSVVAMLSSIPIIARFGWGLNGLMIAYVVSRALFLAGCIVMAPSRIPLTVKGVTSRDIRWGIESSFAIGVIGFVVVVYNAADLLALSNLAGVSDVAVYSAAQRFTWPLLMALNAIAVSFYPVFASLKSPVRFREACQQAVDTTLLLGGLALVCLWCGAEFFMSLLGREFVYGADVLRILAVMSVVKALSMVIGPVLFLVRAQSHALRYTVMALVIKVAVVAAVIPYFGYLGAALATLCVEVFFLAPVSFYAVRNFTGFSVKPWRLLRMAAIITAVVVITRTALPQGNLAGVAMAASLYAMLVLALRIVAPSELRAILRKNPL